MDGVEEVASESDVVGPVILVAVIAVLIWYLFLRDTTPKSTAWKSQASGKSGISNGSQANSLAALAKDKNMIILFGSQTGTAEDFSHRLAQEGKQWGFNAIVCDLQDHDHSEIEDLDDSKPVVFVVATYGEGEPTDNAAEFHEWITEETQGEDSLLSNLHFTVFGLGNTSYEHYQYMGKTVEKRLVELGATLVFQRGEGDEDNAMEDDFSTWQEEMWPALSELYHTEAVAGGTAPAKNFELAPVPIDEVEDALFKRTTKMKKSGLHDVKSPYLAPVTDNRELMKGDCGRSCRHIALNIDGSGMKYDAGDHVAVLPSNDTDLLERLAARLSINLDDGVTLKPVEGSSKKTPFPVPCTLREAFGNYTDIVEPVTKFLIKGIAQYAMEESEKEELLFLAASAPESKAKYNKWIKEDERNIVDLLEHFSSLQPPIDHLLELLPRLQPRFYSISSSPKEFKKEVHITAVLVDWVTEGTKRERKGVATYWLDSLRNGGDFTGILAPCYVRKSTGFHLPKFSHVPVIMVGPGTGIAPFRGFIQDRSADRKKGKEVGETLLFFGARTRDEFLYEEEMLQYVREGTLTDLVLAFSREQTKKVYVQDKLREKGERVWKLMDEQKAHFYICGDAKNMSREVHNALQDIAMEHGKLSEQEAKAWIEKTTKAKRISMDVW